MKKHGQGPKDIQENTTELQLGEKAVIDVGAILGYPPSSGEAGPLIIGPRARIRQGTVVYGGSHIGGHLETGHNVVIRERNHIGDNLRIWSNSTIDYGCRLGSNIKIHHNVYVAQFTTIEDDAFLAPGVCLANDIHPGCPDSLMCMRGPLIKRGVHIGINACVLPRVTIGEYALIGAGSVVTRDIPPRVVAYGNPARVVGRVEDVVCTTGLRDKPYRHLSERVKSVYTLR